MNSQLPASEILVSHSYRDDLPQPDRWTFWYFGEDYSLFVKTSYAWQGNIASVGAEINTTFKRIRNDLFNFDRIIASGRFRLSFFSSNISERNPITSDFMLNICRALTLIESAQKGGSHFVLVDNVSFGIALTKDLRRAGLSARWKGPKFSVVKYSKEVLRAQSIQLRDWFAERWAIVRFNKSLPLITDHTILLITWVDTCGINEEGEPYYGSLPSWLASLKISFSWIGNPARWMGPIKKIVSANVCSSQPAALIGNYQNILSLLKAYMQLAVLPLAFRWRLKIAGFDFSSLLALAILKEFTSTRVVSAALFSCVAKGLSDRQQEPAGVIYTFENQPWEKAMLMGFRRYLPNTIMVGIQTAPFSDNFIGVVPTSWQWENNTAPDFIITNSEKFRKKLIEGGAPAQKVLVGGSLRFPDALDRKPGSKECIIKLKALVSCPMDFNESLELVHKASSAINSLNNAELLINFHPMVSNSFKADIKKYIEGYFDCSQIQFVDGVAMNWLNEVGVVIYNSSGVALEAAMLGVPAVFVGSDLRLDIDKMSGRGRLRCRQPDELRMYIERLAVDSAFRRGVVESMQAYVEECFSPLSPEFWTSLAREIVKNKVK